MDIHEQIFYRLKKIVPGLNALGCSKAPCLLVSWDRLPVNLHILEKEGESMNLMLGSYPFNDHGLLIPAPEVEILLDIYKGRAVPLSYTDTVQRLVRKDLSKEGRKQLDGTVYSWLVMLHRLGFSLERGFGGPDVTPFPGP